MYNFNLRNGELDLNPESWTGATQADSNLILE